MWQIISDYIELLVTTIGVFAFGKIVLDKKIQVSKSKFIISLLIVSITHTIIYIYLSGTIKTLIMGIVDIIFYKYIFNLSIKKSFFLTFIYMVILIFADLLQLLFITQALNLSLEFCYNEFAGSILGNVTTVILLVSISLLIKNILSKLINTKVENNVQIIIFSSLIFICTLMFFYTIIKEYNLGENIIIYLISIFVLVSILAVLIKQTIENNKLTEQYDKLLEFMKQYEQEAENQRILRHETKNEFLAIKAKLYDKQKNKEVIEYIDEILKDKIELKQEEFAKFVYLPANGIKGLCYFKTQEAKDKGLNTSINISKRVENSNIYKLSVKEQRDLGKILGVFLDNAIEASLNSKAKEFGIEAYLNIKKECEIIISNSYDGELEVDKIGKERFTTKGKNRGHGLLLVNHLVSKNDKFAINTKITNGLYIQTLTIKKITKKNEHKK